jgi:hypothetical protein
MLQRPLADLIAALRRHPDSPCAEFSIAVTILSRAAVSTSLASNVVQKEGFRKHQLDNPK